MLDSLSKEVEDVPTGLTLSSALNSEMLLTGSCHSSSSFANECYKQKVAHHQQASKWHFHLNLTSFLKIITLSMHVVLIRELNLKINNYNAAK